VKLADQARRAGTAPSAGGARVSDLEERRLVIDRFNARVDAAQAANPPTKDWVRRALRREGSARCPVRLKALSYDAILQHAGLLADLFEAFPDDIVSIPPYDPFIGFQAGGRDAPIDTIKVLTEDAEWTDEWGTRLGHAKGGVGATPVGVPISDWSELDDYIAHRIPSGSLPGRLGGALPALRLHGATKFCDGRSNNVLFERLHFLRGMERTLEDLYVAPREVERLLDALTDYYLEIIRAWAALGNVDAIYATDDWGTQKALMISPDMWRRFFGPRYRRLCDEAHSHGIAIVFHSCGNVFDIIGDLIDVGVDVINPLQPEAMDLPRVAREFGGKVAFWGGLSDQAISVQTPEQVRDGVRRAIDLLGAPFGNAYVLCLSNLIMPEIPQDNLVALFEACHSQ
jgi:uroporphyrinogen decarboxylase